MHNSQRLVMQVAQMWRTDGVLYENGTGCACFCVIETARVASLGVYIYFECAMSRKNEDKTLLKAVNSVFEKSLWCQGVLSLSPSQKMWTYSVLCPCCFNSASKTLRLVSEWLVQ